MANPIAFPADGLADEAIALQPLGEEHLAELIVAADDPDIVRYTMVPSPYGEREAREFLRQAGIGMRSGAQLVTVISDRADGRLGGTCAVRRRENDPAHWAVGYWVARDARGRGLASRAVRILCDYAFRSLGCERMTLLAEAENAGSVGVAARCGFQLEGALRSYQVIAGERRDLLSFSLLPGDPMG